MWDDHATQLHIFKQRSYICGKSTSQQVNIASNKTTVNHISTAVSLCNNVINVCVEKGRDHWLQ